MQFRELASRLLDPDSGYGELKAAADELLALLCEATGIRESDLPQADSQATRLPSGEAISPLGAALCLRDFYRTSQFLRGSAAAIRQLRTSFPGERIRVLYAGCGPFATLALPQTVCFAPSELELVLLDLHPRCLETAAFLVQRFGLGDYVREYVEADAVTYRCSDSWRPHLVLSETMQKALDKEPQVAIVANLAPQLEPGGRVVPERVTVSASLWHPSTEFALPEDGAAVPEDARRRIVLGPVFELTRDTRLESLKPVVVELPDPIPPGFSLMLQTRIVVFDEFCLGDHDSGLTGPKVLDMTGMKPGDSIEFEYRPGPSPGLQHRVLPRAR